MKKNKMMRLASAMMVLTLMSTSVISGTFAKYVTSDSASDSARVAKWGISLQVVGDLYGDTYKDTIIANDDSTMTVQAAELAVSDKNVVAPGTKNNAGLSFGLTGKPEVDYQIDATIVSQNIFLKAGTYGLMVPVESGKITAENFTAGLYKLDGDKYVEVTSYEAVDYYTLEDEVTLSADYYPVVYDLAGAGTDVSNTGNITRDSLNDAASVIALALNGSAVTASTDSQKVSTYTLKSKVYDSNTDISTAVKLSNMSVTWGWEFSNGVIYDGADTILGNLMAARKSDLEGEVVKLYNPSTYEDVVPYTDYCLDTQFSIDITVTQVD